MRTTLKQSHCVSAARPVLMFHQSMHVRATGLQAVHAREQIRGELMAVVSRTASSMLYHKINHLDLYEEARHRGSGVPSETEVFFSLPSSF